jgi:hypothetical protein
MQMEVTVEMVEVLGVGVIGNTNTPLLATIVVSQTTRLPNVTCLVEVVALGTIRLLGAQIGKTLGVVLPLQL